jgi:hypothetical protein
MALILSGTNGLSDVDGSAATPAIRGTDANTGMFFPAADTIAFSEGGAEVMRINSSGNVGIGTTNPFYKLEVNGSIQAASNVIVGGTGEYTPSGVTTLIPVYGIGAALNESQTTISAAFGSIGFYTGVSAPDMLLDSSGNLLVGTTTATERLTVAGNISINTSGNPFLQIRTSGSGNNPYIRLQAATLTWDIQGTFSNAGDELYFLYGGAARSYINSSTGAYVAVSDQRLKKDITNISYGLSAVMALRPVEYLMNTEADDAQKHLGFIAQEAQAVIPNSVSEMTGGMYGMDKTEIIPVLVKAIQEQQAMIEQLKADVAALKGTV